MWSTTSSRETPMNRVAFVTAASVLMSLSVVTRAADAPPPPPEKLSAAQSKFFESKIRPLLVAHCYKCHSAEERKAKGGLTLDTRDGWSTGGKHGPAIVPGKPESSLLLKAVRHDDADLQMPPNGDKLKDGEIAALEEWIRMGAPDPRRATAETAAKLTGMNDAARSHWAFQPVKDQPVPTVKNAAWVKTPVDAFVL